MARTAHYSETHNHDGETELAVARRLFAAHGEHVPATVLADECEGFLRIDASHPDYDEWLANRVHYLDVAIRRAAA